MTAGRPFFVDTNVLLYTIDFANPEKQWLAEVWRDALWQNRAGRLSWQVLNEFYSNATRKLRTVPKAARPIVESYSEWQPVGFSLSLVQRAWHWMDSAGLPYWDSLIVAAAETAGCAYLLSEDFQVGRKFADLTVVNPFRSRPGDFGLD